MSAPAPAASAALDIFELLASRGEPVPATSIARSLGLPRSSVYHLLSVLTARGYVTHLPDERRYGLGIAAYELGSAFQRQEGLARLARLPWTASSARPATTRIWRSCTAATSSTSSSNAPPAAPTWSPMSVSVCPPR